MKEIFKDIPNYEGMYQVSNLGRVKSLSREYLVKGKYPSKIKERILKPSIIKGYYIVGLYKNDNHKLILIHQLVAMVFLNHTPNGNKLVVDHINNIKSDNRLENLQLITNRENLSKDKKGYSSKYVGVGWYKNANKWQSQIRINGKTTHLGYFTTELEANQSYQNKLTELKNK